MKVFGWRPVRGKMSPAGDHSGGGIRSHLNGTNKDDLTATSLLAPLSCGQLTRCFSAVAALLVSYFVRRTKRISYG